MRSEEHYNTNKVYMAGLDPDRASLLRQALEHLGPRVRQYNAREIGALRISWRTLTTQKTLILAAMMEGEPWYDGNEQEVMSELLEYFGYLNRLYGWRKEVVLGNICKEWGVLPWYTRMGEAIQRSYCRWRTQGL